MCMYVSSSNIQRRSPYSLLWRLLGSDTAVSPLVFVLKEATLLVKRRILLILGPICL